MSPLLPALNNNPYLASPLSAGVIASLTRGLSPSGMTSILLEMILDGRAPHFDGALCVYIYRPEPIGRCDLVASVDPFDPVMMTAIRMLLFRDHLPLFIVSVLSEKLNGGERILTADMETADYFEQWTTLRGGRIVKPTRISDANKSVSTMYSRPRTTGLSSFQFSHALNLAIEMAATLQARQITPRP